MCMTLTKNGAAKIKLFLQYLILPINMSTKENITNSLMPININKKSYYVHRDGLTSSKTFSAQRKLPSQTCSEKDSSDSHEVSKHSLLSDQQSASTSQLVAMSETKKKELSKRSLTSSTVLAHRVEHRERTDHKTKVRVKYSSTREKRV